MTYIAAIDQGTTSARTIIYNEAGIIQADHRTAIHSLFPQNGWVEQHPEDLWAAALTTWRSALDEAGLMASDIAMLGMTNQRETTLLWDAVTGQPVYNAIVWQDRRTKQHCDELKRQGVESLVQQKTGLLLDPYFSATKIAWILQNIPQAKRLAEQGQLRFGTVDTFILWHLTEGKVFATDATNASRTLLFNIFSQSWDQELLDLFEIPESILPTVKNTVDDFGETTCGEWQAVIPIRVVIGDQQAALIGQGCVNRGMAKSTYGTGCFMMMNTGEKAIASDHRLLSTVAYRFAGKTHYALEGSIFCAGVTMQWLQDNVHMIKNIAESSRLAQAVKDNGGVYFVPAFTGLAAPHWLPDARATIMGITRDTRLEHIVRSALEAVCYQTRDLILAMEQDADLEMTTLRVDGGMTANLWLLQFLSDILRIDVERPESLESTAYGVAQLLRWQCGALSDEAAIATDWSAKYHYEPAMAVQQAEGYYQGWLKALRLVCAE